MIKFLSTKELVELKEKSKQFLAQPQSVIEKHSHLFRKVFIHHSGMGLLNSRAYNACFDCGEMIQIPINEELDKEISSIISALAKSKKYG